MSWSLVAKLDIDALTEVQDALQLPHPALVEKDYYVVKALSALSAFIDGPVRLVFGGGTALCRAHRLIQRMSEDIDLKIVSDKPMTMGERRAFRETVKGALEAADFPVVSVESFDDYRTHVFELQYGAIAAQVTSLRAGVRVELSAWPIHLPTVSRSIESFAAQVYGWQAEVPSFPCADVVETAAEKFVALTRRIGEERAAGEFRDSTLLRHIYDLHHICGSHDIAPIAALVRHIIPSDQQRGGRRFPAYGEDPAREIGRALRALRTDPAYASAYGKFQRDMVYGKRIGLQEGLDALDRLWKECAMQRRQRRLPQSRARQSAKPETASGAVKAFDSVEAMVAEAST